MTEYEYGMNCYFAMINYLQKYSDRHIAIHNIQEHEGKQSLDHFNQEIKKARSKLGSACRIDIETMSERGIY